MSQHSVGETLKVNVEFQIALLSSKCHGFISIESLEISYSVELEFSLLDVVEHTTV